jgi:hypothetical protein
MREYFAVYTRVAKPPKVVVYLQDNPEKGSKFFLASIGLNIETSDIYLHLSDTSQKDARCGNKWFIYWA